MSTLTVYFCGTGSNSFDFANTNYHQGELVSTLARNHTGHEFADWIIVDGPGSGNMQEAEKWVKSGNYSGLRGTLQGKGWEENVQHAVAVVLGVGQVNREQHTRSEEKTLRKMGVGVETVPGRLWGTREKNMPLHPRISPQALQQKKVEIMSKNNPLTTINVLGWSRGAVTCHMFANALAQTPELAHIPVNIFACDPVPGAGGFDQHRITIGSNVANYVAIFAADERSRGFTPVLPAIHGSTRAFVTTIPGRHATLVGNASVDGDSGFNDLFGPGKVTRNLAEKYLRSWGTPLKNCLDLSDPQMLISYDKMIGNQAQFTKMHDKSYLSFKKIALTQSGSRSVGQGNGLHTDFGSLSSLRPDPVFINSHHRLLFGERYQTLYHHFFDGRKIPDQRLQLELFNLKQMYPHLHKRLTS